MPADERQAPDRSEVGATALSLTRTTPGIEKDRPFDCLGFNENAAFCPWVIAKQVRRLRCIASLHDQENSTVVGVGPAQDDPTLLEEAIHESRMLLPKRLLTTR
jgi:hypothetical protein